MNALSQWLSNVEAWLDARGKGAWIAAMVLGFIFFWPLGLGLLAYMIWRNKFSMTRCRKSYRATHSAPTGNAAFDAYREETLKRLQDEQTAFVEFLERLRKAKDQSEFDRFMDERGKAPPKEASPKDAGVEASEPYQTPGGAAPLPA
ncbi:MAG: DUF2852 domain-containing protein [Pseudomonadota bacterium]